MIWHPPVTKACLTIKRIERAVGRRRQVLLLFADDHDGKDWIITRRCARRWWWLAGFEPGDRDAYAPAVDERRSVLQTGLR